MTQTVGGQAIIEGVMMKSSSKIAMSVRTPKNKIISKVKNYKPISKKYKTLNLPILRGNVNLIEMMIEGIQALNFSSNIALEKNTEDSNNLQIFITLILSVSLALIIFKLVPLGIAQLFSFYSSYINNVLAFNAIEGLTKIGLFVGYIFSISLMADVKRLFQYHGAEHKTVNCYESSEELTIENAQKFTTIHPRCGTSFIILVLFISILVYAFIPTSFSFLTKYGLRLSLLPLIIGSSFEIIRISPKYQKNKLFKILITPGLWIQKLTTKEPTDDQVEVAIHSLKQTL